MKPNQLPRWLAVSLCMLVTSSAWSIPLPKEPGIRLKMLSSQSAIAAERTLAEALRTNNPRLFGQLRQTLRQTPNAYTIYWTAYSRLYESIYYLQKGDKKQAEAVIIDGIRLAETQPRSSEDYALLAYLQSYAIQFRNGLSAAFASAKVKRNAEEALQLDPRNPRAYYVLGSNDFYMPVRYGGGKTAEAQLLKVLTLPEQTIKNPAAPAWGHENAYELLIRFYLRENQPARARAYFAKARQRYPDSHALHMLTRQINPS